MQKYTYKVVSDFDGNIESELFTSDGDNDFELAYRQALENLGYRVVREENEEEEADEDVDDSPIN